MNGFQVLIPARYASSRLPGKVLLPLAGRPLIEHVHRAARRSGASGVYVATDDARVLEVCERFGARVVLTAADHLTGTDRVAEAVAQLGLGEDEIVVNLQADEPLTPPECLAMVAEDLRRYRGAAIATVCTPIRSAADLHNPNVVKVVMDRDGYALYFSRAPIPWNREEFVNNPGGLPAGGHYRHLGIYAYRVGYLKALAALPSAPAEVAEKLEQLRALYHGAKIHVSVVPEPIPPGVDAADDLARVEKLLQD